MSEKVWVAVKNKQAKDMNRQPLYHINRYAVKKRTETAVFLKCGKIYPPDRCFTTEQECKDSVGDDWKPRKFGDYM